MKPRRGPNIVTHDAEVGERLVVQAGHEQGFIRMNQAGEIDQAE